MASKVLKGLTIEIGGDTTKLGKALENVDKQSRNLSKELSEVNKLLKLDPKNTQLLAQKQEILAKSVSTTKERLDKLKEAEKQVQEQFKKGEVSEEQVRALQREIIATETKLKKFEREAKQATEQTDELGDEAKETGEQLDKAGDEASGFGEAAKKAGNMAVTGFAAVGTAVAALGAGLVGAAEATREYRAEMGKLESAFSANGHSAESAAKTYESLVGVIGETDQSVEAAQQISLLASSEEEAAAWAEQAAGVVGQFGDALQPETFFEAANETIKLGEATGAYVQMLEGTGLSVEEFNAGLAACATEQEKQAYMLEVTEGALGAAGDKYREVNGEIIRANEANDEWMQSLSGVGGAIEPIVTDVKLLGASLLSDLVPGVQSLAEASRGVLNGDVGATDALGAALSNMITDLLNKVVELAPTIIEVGIALIGTLVATLAGQAPQVIETAMGLLTDVVTALIGMIPQLVSLGFEMLTGLLQGVAEAIPLIVQAIVDMLPQLVDALVTGIPMLIEGAVDLLLAIADAIPVLLDALIPTIPTIVMAIVNGLLDNLPRLLEGAITLLLEIVNAIPVLVKTLVPLIPQIVESIVAALVDNLPMLLMGAIELFMALVMAIPEINKEMQKVIPSVIAAIFRGLKNLPAKLGEFFMTAWERVKEVFSTSKVGQYFSSIWAGVKNAFGSVSTWFKDTFSKAWTAVKNVFSTGGKIFDGIKSGISKVFTNVVNGIIRGINKVIAVPFNAINGVLNKVRSVGIGQLKPFQDLWGHNPLTVPVIPQLARGGVLAKGQVGLLEGNGAEAVVPLEKNTGWLRRLAEMLSGYLHDDFDGIQMERGLYSRTNTITPAVAAVDGLSAKLDSILSAIEKGQILMLDGDAVVGATAARMDNALGRRRALASRGAI